ncbi:MAG TPA: exodeoxyribonuclease III [Candidatus Saccharimonadales bacterium]|nr:exodeoxyribonuclease III [Candidatus Saccharimonadales bacterium]
MTIYSWNVNGIRAVLKKDALLPFINKYQPDVICLQEIKATQSQVDLILPDYHQYWYPADKAGYSGTAVFSKIEPLQVINGFPKKIIDSLQLTGDIYGDPNLEGRVIALEYKNIWLVTVYTPNAKEDLSRLELRHKHWDPVFLAYCKQLEKTKPVIFCGDLNVAHTPDDLANPQSNKGKKGFTLQEREGFQNFIDNDFIDSFRLFHKGNGYYTWWSHFANARARNIGWRIDYILLSKVLKKNVKSAAIYPSTTGSDHCPISLTLDM